MRGAPPAGMLLHVREEREGPVGRREANIKRLIRPAEERPVPRACESHKERGRKKKEKEIFRKETKSSTCGTHGAGLLL